jgi:hypothetical protein
VRWPSVLSAAIEARESSRMSSRAKDDVAGDRPAPKRSAPPAEVQRAELQGRRSEAASTAPMLSGALTIALLLAGAILKLAGWLNKLDRWRTAAGWLEAYHQVRAVVAKKTGRQWKRGDRPDSAAAKKTRPSEPDHLTGLQQLIRDLRRAEAETKPQRRFEPDGRQQLRLRLGKAAPRSLLHVSH